MDKIQFHPAYTGLDTKQFHCLIDFDQRELPSLILKYTKYEFILLAFS